MECLFAAAEKKPTRDIAVAHAEAERAPALGGLASPCCVLTPGPLPAPDLRWRICSWPSNRAINQCDHRDQATLISTFTFTSRQDQRAALASRCIPPPSHDCAAPTLSCTPLFAALSHTIVALAFYYVAALSPGGHSIPQKAVSWRDTFPTKAKSTCSWPRPTAPGLGPTFQARPVRPREPCLSSARWLCVPDALIQTWRSAGGAEKGAFA